MKLIKLSIESPFYIYLFYSFLMPIDLVTVILESISLVLKNLLDLQSFVQLIIELSR